MFFFCSGAYIEFVYPERRLRAVARVAGPGAAGRVGAAGAGRGLDAAGGGQPTEAPAHGPPAAQGLRGEIQIRRRHPGMTDG
mgnify:CR=1 FL=1